MYERMSEDMTKKTLLEALARRRVLRLGPYPVVEPLLANAKGNRIQSSDKPATK
jgi:hypothetical protein